MNLTDEHFRILVETVEDYAIFVLDPDGIVQSWNPGAQRIKGYLPSEIIGQHFSTFYLPSDRAAGIPEQGLATARGTRRFADVGWRVRKDGSQFWASVVLTALHDDTGTLIGFAKVTRDLTDRGYRAFVEATNGIIYTTDVDGKPNADSPSWRAFTGQSEAEWRGTGGWAPIHPDDQGALRVESASAKAERKIVTTEFRMRRHDGVYVWMACRAVPFLHVDGTVREWFGVLFDVSARKAAEDAREQAINLWATTLRSIGDGVIATDARGLVTFMNPVAEALTAWTTEQARGKSLAEVFPMVDEDTRQPVENPFESVVREGSVVPVAEHTILVRRDGVEFPVDDCAAPIRQADGSLDGVVLIVRDTSQDKLEAARRAFLARAGDELMRATDYREALSHITQLAVPRLADWCSVHLLEPDSKVPTQLAFAHVDPAKVEYGHRLNARYPADPDARVGVPAVIRTGKSELYKEIPWALLEAAAIDAEHLEIIRELDLRSAMTVPLRDRERTFGALSFIYTGKRRYTEDDLAFAEEFARRASIVVERRRLEEEATLASKAKDEFLAMLGHELRNPLAPIRTALQVMALRSDPSTAKERKVIERQVNHLVTLVDDLLDVSRITRQKIKLELEPIELGMVMGRALEMASPLFEQRLQHLAVSVARTGLVVNADPARLAQVFSNLLTNAAKYTDVGGHITVTASRSDADIVIAVKDTGIGIAPEMLPSIFDMFVQERQTIERSQGGLGLGLNIVRSLVSMHHGRVDVYSAGRGLGSTFTVCIPACDAVVPSSKLPDAPIAPASPALQRVLLVDDNRDAISMLEELVQMYGYETRVAFDGPSALEIARDFKPDLALLDIGLPVMDGYELAQRLRALLLDTPPRLIALTGYGQGKDLDLAMAAGFDRHFVKPVAVEPLRKAMHELLALPRTTSE